MSIKLFFMFLVTVNYLYAGQYLSTQDGLVTNNNKDSLSFNERSLERVVDTTLNMDFS
ncbi:hypothetical protein HYV10_00145 [Candidatus Dependentiae bacterium]|nr:hypothetical protein [Candidatus Dependentiae bacterium]